MKKYIAFLLAFFVLSATACTQAPVPSATPKLPNTTQTATPTPMLPSATQTVTNPPIPAAPTFTPTLVSNKIYTNPAFGLTLAYPANWFGPEEYVSDQTLRVEVGSDEVYPYGEVPEQPSGVKNSYHIVLQYNKENQNTAWDETWQVLSNLKDGESSSGTRGKIIRVRPLELGQFKGYEYIATLSDTAQTEPIYSRAVLLQDEQGDLLTVMGTPNNVEVGSGADWHAVYRSIDEANQAIFHQLVDSIRVK